MRHGSASFFHKGSFECEIQAMQAESLKERLCGLLVLAKLTSRQTLWLQPCNSIHTFGMSYTIDVIYLDKNNVICGLSRSVKPWRINACFKARVTLELAEGSIDELGIQKGDCCQWRD